MSKTTADQMITLTDAAKQQIADILKKESDSTLCVRTYIAGGGCSGFQYGFTLSNEIADDDWSIEAGTFTMLIDSISMEYLQGSTVDYQTDLAGSSFVIKNPNASAKCGCGKSFAI
jgi:iron-sulfur cluster insertion protein